MNIAATQFATLGHPGRLAVFRLLLRHAPHPVRPTDMAQALGVRPNTLSHHLADLQAAGMVSAHRNGRSILYAVQMDTASALVSYLALDCCRGRPDLCLPPLVKVPENRPLNVLFLCSGNSARSIFAEAILNAVGQGRFCAFSAGTTPAQSVQPAAVALLQRQGIATASLHPKSIATFATPDAPRMDFIFSVCDAAASQDCAAWPGQPRSAHWPVPDPARQTGTDAARALAYADAFAALHRRITAFAALPLASLETRALQQRLDLIAKD